jgi:hypothetical protein
LDPRPEIRITTEARAEEVCIAAMVAAAPQESARQKDDLAYS